MSDGNVYMLVSRSKRRVREQGCATSDPIVLAIVLELDPIVFMSSDPIVLGLIILFS